MTSSSERLGPQLPAMATRFYQELFGRDRALREFLVHTRALGARHRGYGVRAAAARTVGT